jgi:hypothetical protein
VDVRAPSQLDASRTTLPIVSPDPPVTTDTVTMDIVTMDTVTMDTVDMDTVTMDTVDMDTVTLDTGVDPAWPTAGVPTTVIIGGVSPARTTNADTIVETDFTSGNTFT